MDRRSRRAAGARDAVLAAAILGGACGGGGAAGPDPVPPPTPPPAATPEPPPVLSVPVVDLGRVAGFIPFGALLANGVLNPAYDFRTAGRDVEVRAVAAGVVSRIGFQPEYDDYEVHVRPAPSSVYLVIYDHVRNLTVAEGTPVAPGAVLGTIGHASPGEGHTELQINRSGSPNVSICPRDLGTEAFNAAHDALFAALRPPHAGVCLAPTVIP